MTYGLFTPGEFFIHYSFTLPSLPFVRVGDGSFQVNEDEIPGPGLVPANGNQNRAAVASQSWPRRAAGQ